MIKNMPKKSKNLRVRSCMRERSVRCEVRKNLAHHVTARVHLLNSRASQAALEFLMTYGWAILVVLVAVGALAYFGVLSPDKFLPAKCTLQSGIACLDHKATSTQIQVVIQNSLGYDLSLVTIKAGGCGSSSSFNLANGEKITATQGTITCAAPLTGSKYNAQLNVSYTITDTGLTHNNLGQITTRIE